MRTEAMLTTITPSDWRSCTVRTMRYQALELRQLHLTVGYNVNLRDTPTSHIEA